MTDPATVGRATQGAAPTTLTPRTLRRTVPGTLPAPRLLDVPGVCAYLSIQRRSVFRLVDRGVLIPVRLPGLRRLLFAVEDLERLVQAAR